MDESSSAHEPLTADVPATNNDDSTPHFMRITGSGKIRNFVKFAVNFLKVSVPSTAIPTTLDS